MRTLEQTPSKAGSRRHFNVLFWMRAFYRGRTPRFLVKLLEFGTKMCGSHFFGLISSPALYRQKCTHKIFNWGYAAAHCHPFSMTFWSNTVSRLWPWLNFYFAGCWCIKVYRHRCWWDTRAKTSPCAARQFDCNCEDIALCGPAVWLTTDSLQYGSFT